MTIDADSRIDGKVLARIRALLAKAESTTFEEEAHAFTAKAQELMTRHAIDVAMLGASAGSDAAISTEHRMIRIEQPYADPKISLLGAVARANRCRAISTATSRS